MTLDCWEDVLSMWVESVGFFEFFIVVGKVGARVLVVVLLFLDLVAVHEVIAVLVGCFVDILIELLAFLLLLASPSAFLLTCPSALSQAFSPE